MRKYLLHVLIISFVFFLTPTIQAASDWEDEIEVYKKAIKINPDDAKAHYNLGNAYFGSGMYNKEAIEACKQAIRINADYALAHYNLGNANVNSGMHKAAIESIKQFYGVD